MAGSGRGCSRDQKQPCPDADRPDGPRDTLTGGCEALDADGNRHHSHRSQIHDSNDEQDRHRPGTAVAAMEAEPQPVSPGRAGVRGQRMTAPGGLPAAGQVTRLPRRELERAGDQHHHCHRKWYGARQCRLLHLRTRQRDTQREDRQSEHAPDEEVTPGDERGQASQPRLPCPANGLPVAP
jgi:hypothetical protein